MLRCSVPVLLVALLACLVVVPARAEWRQREEAIMGTRIAVELWHDDPAQAEAAIDAVMADMHRIDDLMSHYKPESELSQVNAHAAEHPVRVAPELFSLIRRALEISELSGGAFDITYASVGYLYDYRAHIHPSDEQIARALPAVNWHHVLLDPATSSIRYSQPGVRIDLGGIAKGYAVEHAVALLKARGIAHALVTAGGDTRILGDRRGRPWIVGIRHPDDKDRVVLRMPLEDTAISTSGDYERYFDEDGRRYHHIIDPKTGKSAGAVRSVTIIGPDGTTTDGLTKCVWILGPERGLALIDRLPEYETVIVTKEGKVLYSRGLAPP